MIPSLCDIKAQGFVAALDQVMARVQAQQAIEAATAPKAPPDPKPTDPARDADRQATEALGLRQAAEATPPAAPAPAPATGADAGTWRDRPAML